MRASEFRNLRGPALLSMRERASGRDDRPPRRPVVSRSTPVRRRLVPLALTLALATGIVLNQTRLVALAPVAVSGLPPTLAPAGIVVRHFYDAVNTALATGDPTPLTDLVAADFVDHVPRPGVTSDRTGLLASIQLLRTAEPALRLVLDRLLVQDDRVVALVSLDGADPPPVPGLVRGVERPWGRIDVFRVQGDRIAEHWGDPAGLSLASPLLDATVPTTEPVGSVVALDQRTLPPASTWPQVAAGPTVLLVETGTLSVVRGAPARPGAVVVRPGQDPAALNPENAVVVRPGQPPVALGSGNAVGLAPGDGLALPAGIAYRVTVGADAPAVALVLSATAQTYAPGRTPADMSLGTQTERPQPPFADGALVVSAGGVPVDLPGGGLRVTLTRYALAPGAALAAHRVAIAEFILVVSGALDLAVSGGLAWVRVTPGNTQSTATGEALASGSGTQVDAGASVSYRAVGEAPVEFLVVTIERPGSGWATPPSGS